ncbi:ATP-binding cassette domain-containing protein [Aeromicrobium camelliae]|uniref:ATP-binding cassette domain-containing protein n=1 Tax=Aeromicrobium camelliae TaxID=1538144 RepID=A0A3N6YYD2_9ACTN|nr:ATP-binding cassette domain-containing protein [Aeromicrobium camelliae]RQN02791.1 ATP-binding cassette domain-containing protein [Aeromicrobium camelliae]
MPPSEPIVVASGLRKSYGTSRRPVTVLDGIDLILHRGEVLALLGPNGAGKTTTVRILSTLLRPDAGTATIAGHDVLTAPRRVREVISLTGQYAAVDEKLTGRENLALMARLAHLPRPAARARVDDLLEAFDLTDAADRRLTTYSGGMRRRLDLAAGLLRRPQVLFLDEPTTGLDPRSRQGMWEVINEVVAQGTSLFLTTQYLEEADQLAHRVAVIDDGRVVAEGTPTELKRRVGEAGVELTFGSAALAAAAAAALAENAAVQEDRLVRMPTDGSVAHVKSLLARIEAAGAEPEHWEVRAPSLDDVFLTLTGRVARAAEKEVAA